MVDVELARWRPHPEVPVRDQLAAWIASGIRDGEIPADAGLPSVRRLAELVGVHRNTAWFVYRELARRGLVRPVAGSGVFAVGPPAPHGRGPAAPRGRGPVMPRRLAVVERGEGLRAAVVAELELRLGPHKPPVLGLSPRSAVARPARLVGHRVLALPAVCERLAPRLETAGVVVEPLCLRGGRAYLRRLAAWPPPVIVGLLCRSVRVRRFARELLAGWRGVTLVATGEEGAVARVLRVADVVLADCSFRELHRWGGRSGPPIRRLHLLRQDRLNRAGRPRAARPRSDPARRPTDRAAGRDEPGR